MSMPSKKRPQDAAELEDGGRRAMAAPAPGLGRDLPGDVPEAGVPEAGVPNDTVSNDAVNNESVQQLDEVADQVAEVAYPEPE